MVKSLEPSEMPRLDSVFHALSDSTRRSILRTVALGEQTVTEVAQPFQISLAAVSKHLNVLERANLIRREKRGSFQMVRINAMPMKEAGEWLAYYERFWNERLDEFEQFFKDKKDANEK